MASSVGCRIAPYSHGNILNHSPDRDRKRLLHKREILKLGGKVTERGLTLVPLKAYLKNGRVKLEIGLARGKKSHDKRQDIAAREAESAVLRIVRDPAGESGRTRELRELCARVIARIQHEARALRAAGVDAPAALGGLATLETA